MNALATIRIFTRDSAPPPSPAAVQAVADLGFELLAEVAPPIGEKVRPNFRSLADFCAEFRPAAAAPRAPKGGLAKSSGKRFHQPFHAAKVVVLESKGPLRGAALCP